VRVIMAASEAVPFAKTGGLADVVGALPPALQQRGVDVAVILPKYPSVTEAGAALRRLDWTLAVPVSSRTVTAGVWTTTGADGVAVYFIEADPYFARAALYGTASGDYPDNAERFAFFSRAALALAQRLGAPDVFHCHDWQTGLIPVFLRADPTRYADLARTRTVLTVHNIGYHGAFWTPDWHLLNLEWAYFSPEWLEFYGYINYLKGGLRTADAITTVSPTYAREIQTPAFGCGMEGVLAGRGDAVTGILNGVDYTEWNPEHDRFIAAAYSVDDLAGKAACKADLQAAVGLPVDARVPLLGIVSRLVEQKGIDLLTGAATALLRKRVQLVVLGSGEPWRETLLQNLAAIFPTRCAVRIGYDNALAHRIEAGCDMFLMPSRYEPCGLNQMYSLRYGTIPIVRATGGLDDSVVDVDSASGRGTGFKFVDTTPGALLACIGRALAAYRTPRWWRTIMAQAMRADFSWDRSAEAYIELYRRLAAGD